MPCIKVELSTNIAITMPSSPVVGTPIYHFQVAKIPLKTWKELSPKLQQLYASKLFSSQSKTPKVSSVLLLALPSNNRFEIIGIHTNICQQEQALLQDDGYEDQVLIDSFTKYCSKNFKKITWTLKNICI